jgi:hypothetical protein
MPEHRVISRPVATGSRRCPHLAAGAALLLACSGAPDTSLRPAGAPVVRLDHLYLVLDSATHAAIAADEFLSSEFAAVQVRTTATVEGRSWTGLYLQGRLTYVELFTPGSFGPAGASGMGLNVGATGDAEYLRGRLHEAFGDSGTVQPVTGMREGNPQPWFYSLRAPAADSSTLSLWVMEYHESFLRWQGLDSLAPDGRLMRRQRPRRAHDPQRLLGDVVAVRIALADDERARVVRQLAAFGWQVGRAGAASIARGQGCTITLEAPAAGRTGIRSLTLSLRNAVPSRTTRIGTTSLALADTLAVWTFW